MRVLNKVYQTIEKNEMRLAEQDRKEATRVEWQQVGGVRAKKWYLKWKVESQQGICNTYVLSY